MKNLMLLMLSIITLSCGQTMTNDGSGGQARELNSLNCFCTREYNPVCAYVNNKYVTFSNGCMAQCSGHGYKMGACTTSTTGNGQQCNLNSGQVCGQVQITCDSEYPETCTTTVPQAAYYANECEMLNNGAVRVDSSQCSNN